VERQRNFKSRLQQRKVIGEKRSNKERGIHACPALTRWGTTISRSPRKCPWEICPMGHRYIVIQGAHVDVVYGKWPGEAGSRSRQKGCLPQPLRADAQAPQPFGANILLCLDSKYIQCWLTNCLNLDRKGPFCVVATTTLGFWAEVI
jgi:hypothetical protein